VNGNESTIACMTLLFLRQDRPRSEGMAYWRGPHAQLVARAPGRREYRQHHFSAEGGGWWPAPEGVETTPQPDRRVDGISEVTFTSPLGALRGRGIDKLVQADEGHAFRRTVVYRTGSNGARWWRSGSDVQARAGVLLRRAPEVSAKEFARFAVLLAERLRQQPFLKELRTFVFSPLQAKQSQTPGVEHDNPVDEQFHGAVLLGAGSHDELRIAVTSALLGFEQCQRDHLAAAHAYDIELTLLYRNDNRPTLPQTTSTPARIIRKPALAPGLTSLPKAPPRSRDLRSSKPFPAGDLLPLPGDGPEDVILDADANLVTGLDGGRIVRVNPDDGATDVLADTAGRPLGLELLPDGRLLVCDAHRGLLRVDPASGRVETLVEHVRGIPLRFCSNAAVEPDGTIWFTESTNRFDIEHYLGAFLERRASGRLLRRDVNGDVEVVLDNLFFANGVTLTPDGKALLFAETGAARISRLPLTGPAAGHPQVVADNLPATPDNLSRFAGGRTWAGMPVARDAGTEKFMRLPGLVAKALWALPDNAFPAGKGTTWVMAFDEEGTVVADLQTPDALVSNVTGVVERRGELFCASTGANALLRVPLT